MPVGLKGETMRGMCADCDYDSNCHIQEEVSGVESNLAVTLVVSWCRRGKYARDFPSCRDDTERELRQSTEAFETAHFGCGD